MRIVDDMPDTATSGAANTEELTDPAADTCILTVHWPDGDSTTVTIKAPFKIDEQHAFYGAQGFVKASVAQKLIAENWEDAACWRSL